MRKILITLIIFAAVACKNDKISTEEVTKTEAPKNEFFQVILDVVAKKDDNFHIFYSEDGTVNFTEENSVWVAVKGSESSQKVVFNVPNDKLPTLIRIDFGLTENQGDIKINNLEMSYFGKVSTISGADFFKFFRPNEANTVIDAQAQTLKALLKPGQPFSGPSVYPLEEQIGAEIKKITN